MSSKIKPYITAFVLALAAQCGMTRPAFAQGPAPTPDPDGYTFSAMVGGTVSMAPGTDTQLAPIARLQVDGPLAFGSAETAKLPRLHVTADLEALPGQTIDQTGGIAGTLAQFKSLRFTVGASQRISKWVEAGNQRIATSVYIDGGFSTRLDNEHVARDKAPRYVSAGVRFDEKTSGSFLKVGMGPDQRLDGTYQLATHIEAYAKAYEMKADGGAEIGVFARAILGVDISSPTRPGLTGGAYDSVNVGFIAGWN